MGYHVSITQKEPTMNEDSALNRCGQRTIRIRCEADKAWMFYDTAGRLIKIHHDWKPLMPTDHKPEHPVHVWAGILLIVINCAVSLAVLTLLIVHWLRA